MPWTQVGNIFGTNGTNGTNGTSAIASTTGTNPNTPAVGSTETYTVNSTAGLLTQQYYGFQGVSGTFLITAIPSATTVTLQNVDAAAGSAIAAGTKLGPVGKTGIGGGKHTVQDETTDLTPRSKLAFVGPGVTATDDAAGDRTVVTINATETGSSGSTRQTLLSDDFVAPNGTAVIGRTPDIGQPWIKLESASGNGAINNNSATTTDTFFAISNVGATSYSIELNLSYGVLAVGNVSNFYVRAVAGDPASCIIVQVEINKIVFFRYQNGTLTSLATHNVSAPAVLKIDVTPTTILATADGVALPILNNTDFASNTFVGFGMSPVTGYAVNKIDVFSVPFDRTSMPFLSADPAAIASNLVLFARADGLLYVRLADGTVRPVTLGAAVPPI